MASENNKSENARIVSDAPRIQTQVPRAPANNAAAQIKTQPLSKPAPVPFTTIVPTVYGQMLVNRYDINQANALFKTGRAIDHNEIVTLAQILRAFGTDLTVLDVGANFGTYSLALAQVVGKKGQVHSFEPQRLIYNLLVGSVALNSLTRVYCHNIALGEEEGRIEIPQYDYNRPMNFGSVEFTDKQTEKLPQPRGNDPTKVEYVRLTTIDSFNFEKAHLIKIDAEGMELAIVRGGLETIRRCRPVLYVEFFKSNRETLKEQIEQLEYQVHIGKMNFLCIPKELGNRIRITRNS